MTARVNPTDQTILDALELLGGWATCAELAARSGYVNAWINEITHRLCLDGTLQKSKATPYIYSLRGKTLVKVEPIDATPAGLTKLAKQVAHLQGTTVDPIVKYVSRRGQQTYLSPEKMSRLLKVAGYRLVLIPEDETK